MKKILAILLVLAMILSFAACGKKETGKTEEPEKVWPEGIKEVQVIVPNPVGAMLDQSTRVMVEYLNSKYADTKFTVVNEDAGGGNKAGIMLAQAAGDGSVIMAHGAGAIIQFYSGTWDNNLADRTKYISIAGNVGQLQPSGGVFLINAKETKFTDLPSLVQYVNDHPGEVRFSYGTGTPHEIRMKLITEYYGITDKVKWTPGSTNEVRTWIQGGNTDVAILTETTACADIRGGAVVGILDSLTTRNYTDDLKDVLDNVKIVTDYVPAADADGLVCAWPMTIYGPASMSEKTAKEINAACCGIADSPEFMAKIKALGSTNTYQKFTFEEINELTAIADKQVKDIFDAINNK